MISCISWCWAGVLLGVSFVSTPAKFRAAESSLAQLLEVGMVTFNTLMIIECALTAIWLLVILRNSKWLLLYRGLVPFCLFLMVCQYLYLLPLLDLRVELIIQGIKPAPSFAHWLYILIELSKVAILITIGQVALSGQHKELSYAVT